MATWRNRAARALRPDDRGQAIAELALIAPLMVLLLIGLVELARYATFSIEVSNAARAGVQYGAQNLVVANDNVAMQNAALADAANLGAGLTATATHFCTCANGTASTCQPTDCSGSHRLVYVQVDTSETFMSMLHYPGVLNSLQIKGHAVMRVVQ